MINAVTIAWQIFLIVVIPVKEVNDALEAVIHQKILSFSTPLKRRLLLAFGHNVVVEA